MEEKSKAIDLRTPRNASLTAFYKRSFAYHTVKNRMPIILTQLIDILVRKKEDIKNMYGNGAQEELKTIIGEISKLKYEIQTNKPLGRLKGTASDIKFYNDYLDQQASKLEHPTFFNAVWLHTECYMYRKLREIFEVMTVLKDFDPFIYQKQESYTNSVKMMEQLGTYLRSVSDSNDNSKQEFIKLLKLNLWGNKCDLSITQGTIKPMNDNSLDLDQLQSHILCDDSEEIWRIISDQSANSNIIDIVLDNSGYELFTDFCMSDFIISRKLARKIRFHVKSIPWFISDVTVDDFNWTLKQLKEKGSSVLKKLGERWLGYIKNKTWIIEHSDFWTLPVTFTNMSKIDPELYKKLAESKLIIFKGDLNYRKLFGEKFWDPVTPVDDALQGFHPSKLCILRTLKADIICGLRKGMADEMDKKSNDWMVSGDYGVIQFSEQVVSID